MAKNDLARRLKENRQQIALEKEMAVRATSRRFAHWVMQAGVDALVMTLGYDDVMKGHLWGEQRIYEFAAAWATNALHIMQGMGLRPDADAIREETDKLIKKKMPHKDFVPWEERYEDWKSRSVEAEREMFLKYWQKTGQATKDDGGTSQLLKGVGK